MDLNDTLPATTSTNPKLRALVKQIANLMDEARTEQVLQEALGTWTQDAHLKDLDREIDQRWQTIERLAQELLCHHPCDLEEAGAQARVSLVLSNAGHWDEDHSLTALARILVASNGSKPSDPSLADALARIEDC